MTQNIYAEGCFSTDYKSAGVAWKVHPEVHSSLPLVGIKSQREINFMAQYYCVKNAHGIIQHAIPVLLHTSDPVIYRIMQRRQLLDSLAVGRDIYSLLDQYQWDIALTNLKDPNMAQVNALAREAMHELRDVIKPKNHRERLKFKRKQGKRGQD